MMKRLYHALALLAIVNLLAIAGMIGFLVATGRVDAERAEQIAMVLRGEFPEPPADAAATQPAATRPAERQRSAQEIAQTQARRQFYELLAERHQREMEDRRKLNEELRLDVVRELEQIDEARKQLKEQRKQLSAESGEAGFALELEVISKVDPAQAKDLLKGRFKDPDVVRLLMQMDANRVSKIVDACKTQDELDWIGRILNQIGKLNAEAVSGVEGPAASSSGG